MKRLSLCVVAAIWLAGCGASYHVADEGVQNPYVKKANTLAEAGISAMQAERWAYAQNVFIRALKAAQLTDNPQLVAKQWYNLGAAHVAIGNHQEALHDFHEAQFIAERSGDSGMRIRTRLARALLPGQAPLFTPDMLAAKYPIDIHLAAARLAQKQQRDEVAAQEYHFVVKKSGKSRLGLLYQAQAHLGLAMLARKQQNIASAKREVRASLDLFRQAGAPRFIAYALLFYGKLEIPINDRRESLQRACVIYQALENMRGKQACLAALAAIPTPAEKVRTTAMRQ